MNIQPPKANILYEDEEVMIVLDIDPISQGHALILPKIVYKDLDDLPEALMHKIMKLARIYVSILKETFSPMGYSIMQNGGAFNELDQFHLHVFPRFQKEEFSWTYAEDVPKEAKDFSHLQSILAKEIYSSLKN
ncbi:MAG: HIT family protein [Bacteroidota bacterium]